MLGPLPNLHAALVHFPIAMLAVGVLVDVVALAWRSRPAVRHLASFLLVTGAVLLVPTFLSGQRAGDEAESAFAGMQRVLGAHADWATGTMWFFLAYAVLRLAFEWRRWMCAPVHAGMVALSLVGGFLLFETGEHGGELVYQMGVGVRPPPSAAATAVNSAMGGPTRSSDGSLRWLFTENSDRQFQRLFDLTDEQIRVALELREASLVLRPATEGRHLMLLADPYGDVMVDAELNRDSSRARVALIHHFADAENYDALLLHENQASLVRVENGRERVLDRKPLPESGGWHRFRVVGSGGHFRGYQDGRLVVHGHAPARTAGRVGIGLEGRGPLRLESLEVTPIPEH